MAKPSYPAGLFIRGQLENSKNLTDIKLRCLERLRKDIEKEKPKPLNVPGYFKAVVAVCKNSRNKLLVRGALTLVNVLIDKVDITLVPIDIQRELVSSILLQTVIRGREFDAVCDHLRQVMGEVVDEELEKLKARVPVKKLTRSLLDEAGLHYDDTDLAQLHRILCSAYSSSSETYNATDLLEQYATQLSDRAKDYIMKVLRDNTAVIALPTTSDAPSDDAVDESAPEFENPIIVEQDISLPGSIGEQNIALPGSIGEQDTTLPRPIVELNIPLPGYFGEQNVLLPGSIGEHNIDLSSSIGEQDTTLPRPIVELNIPLPGYFDEQNITLPGSNGDQNILLPGSIGDQDISLPGSFGDQ